MSVCVLCEIAGGRPSTEKLSGTFYGPTYVHAVDILIGFM